jgi:hypothetical protein
MRNEKRPGLCRTASDGPTGHLVSGGQSITLNVRGIGKIRGSATQGWPPCGTNERCNGVCAPEIQTLQRTGELGRFGGDTKGVQVEMGEKKGAGYALEPGVGPGINHSVTAFVLYFYI